MLVPPLPTLPSQIFTVPGQVVAQQELKPGFVLTNSRLFSPTPDGRLAAYRQICVTLLPCEEAHGANHIGWRRLFSTGVWDES